MNHWHVALSIPVVALLVVTESLPLFILNLVSLYATPFLYLSDGFSHLLSFFCRNENAWFLLVFVYRYYRFLGHLFANYFLYSPAPIPAQPKVTPKNVHVIIPTIDPVNSAFDTCIRSILTHHPKGLTIVTGGRELQEAARTVARSLAGVSPNTVIDVLSTDVQNKRVQINRVLMRLYERRAENKDTIVVCVDDHAWWKGERFLEHLLAPFEDPKIALVGTRKEVARMRGTSWVDSFINLVGCLYLERHNFEITGQNALDGGVLVVSARTCAIRASVVLNEDFMGKYIDERFFFNMCGPLNSDDDNFVTRYILRQGWKIKFQSDADNATCTDIGINGLWKIDGQLTRWARSQWRSNPASLFTESLCWQHRLWWTSHAAYGAWFINAPIWTDYLMWRAWSNCTWTWLPWWLLLGFQISAKIIKLSGHFRRHPSDLLSVDIVLYFMFTYAHVTYKIRSLFTFNDTTWSGRKLKSDVKRPGSNGDNDDNDGNSSGDDSDDAGDEYGSRPQVPSRSTPSSMPSSRRSSSRPDHSGYINTGPSRSGQKLSLGNGSTSNIEAVRQDELSPSALSSASRRRSSVGMPISQDSKSPFRSSSYNPENSTRSRPGDQYFGPSGYVRKSSPHLTPTNVRESQVSPHNNDLMNTSSVDWIEQWYSAPEGDVLSGLPIASPMNRSFTSRRPHRPSDVYVQPYFESVENGYDESQPQTPPKRISPSHPVRKESWTRFIPSPEISPTPPPRRPSHTLGKITYELDPPAPTRKPSAGSKQGHGSSGVIRSAADFLKTIPLFRLPEVHTGEDYNGVPSPIRSVHNPFFPAPQIENIASKPRKDFTRPRRPSLPVQPISKAVEERIIRQELEAQRREEQERSRNVSPYKYDRKFVRGCTCRRIHGSGTWLSVPSKPGSCAQCRSPSPNIYDARWR